MPRVTVCCGDAVVWDYAQQHVAQSGRAVDLSVFLDWAQWPDDIGAALAPWQARGATRALITIGWHANLADWVHQIADAGRSPAPARPT